MVLRYLPHALTLTRLFVLPFVVRLLLQSRFREALGLVVLAGVTDWFDGFAARRLHVTGRLGVVLDPIADKTMLVTLFVALAFIRLIPLWLLALVIGRDVVIVVGALLLRIFRNIRRFLPSTMGKVSTFFQIMLVLMVLLHASFQYRLFWWLEVTAVVLCAFFTVLSGIGYVRLGIQLTRRPALAAG